MMDPDMEPAVRYFNFLARRFPVMCASDEFHFLPRAEAASKYYDRLEDLGAQTIEDCLAQLKAFRREFSRQARLENDLERQIDWDLLTASVSGLLIDLDNNRSWRHNPLLYLKIAFIGLDHALSKPAATASEAAERLLSRASAVPGLIGQAIENLGTVPLTFHQAGRAMLKDGRHYLAEIAASRSGRDSGRLDHALQKAGRALDDLDKFLIARAPLPDHKFFTDSMEASLREHFLSIRGLDEVFQLAKDEWRENLGQLEKLQKEIDPDKSWQELYHQYKPSFGTTDTLDLYRQETERLRRFFGRLGFRKEDLCSDLKIAETPTYLKSVRSTASFSAAFTADIGEKSFFYITTHLPRDGHTAEANQRLNERLHREYRFLSAHETIPGHHLLDTIRRRLKNPVRRQIESPLFYEGWAYYAESLLTEYGYVDQPLDFLVDHKRRLWRSARCQIDVGLPAGFLDREQAVELLTTTGFSSEEAARQVHRFQLNPGYQLCYSLGRYEILQLKQAYGSLIGAQRFHSCLLEGGQLPFHLIKKRFQAKNP
jgi:uncharacterized protein (DUF885 family)